MLFNSLIFLLFGVIFLSLSGIDVYLLRLPTTSEMLQLENEQSGFDETFFRREIESSGGIWLDLPPADYNCYDGSHLHEASAKEYSIRLAKQIFVHMKEMSVEQ